MLKSLKLDYPPKHYGTMYSSQNVNWIPSDSEENFKKNIAKADKRQYLESMGWQTPGCFTYKINQHGFRTSELVFDPNSFVALGCSFTIGIGLPIESVWPSLISSKIDTKVYNLGVGGASLDTIFRIADYWLPIIQPKFVILLVPPITRFEVRNDFNGHVYAAVVHNHHSLAKEWFSVEENAKNNARKNILAIQNICNEYNIALFVFNSSLLTAHSDARDFLHQGPKDHEILVELMLEQGIQHV